MMRVQADKKRLGGGGVHRRGIQLKEARKDQAEDFRRMSCWHFDCIDLGKLVWAHLTRRGPAT